MARKASAAPKKNGAEGLTISHSQHRPQGPIIVVLFGQDFGHPSSQFRVLTKMENGVSIGCTGTNRPYENNPHIVSFR
jgi:hypothetical protein